jgi:(S)-sulfolactate dehydrogenase
MLLRRGGYFATARILAGEWPRAELSSGHDAEGKVFGVIGLGAIGEITARKAQALDFRVIAHSPSLPEDHPAWQIAERVSLDRLCLRIPLPRAGRLSASQRKLD